MQLGGTDVHPLHGAALPAAGAVDDHDDAQVLQHSALRGVHGQRNHVGTGRSERPQGAQLSSGSACASSSSESPSTSWRAERKSGIALFVPSNTPKRMQYRQQLLHRAAPLRQRQQLAVPDLSFPRFPRFSITAGFCVARLGLAVGWGFLLVLRGESRGDLLQLREAAIRVVQQKLRERGNLLGREKGIHHGEQPAGLLGGRFGEALQLCEQTTLQKASRRGLRGGREACRGSHQRTRSHHHAVQLLVVQRADLPDLGLLLGSQLEIRDELRPEREGAAALDLPARAYLKSEGCFGTSLTTVRLPETV